MDAPTVNGLCVEFFRIADWYTAGWCVRFPHLRDEFKSRAAFDLFTAARGYVAKGPEMWGRMRFALYLKICVHRGCERVAFVETKRRSRVGAQHRPGADESEEMAGREAPPDESLGADEQFYADLERVVRLLDLGHMVTPEDAELLLRHYVDGETVADLAREHGRPHSTIHTRITRAIEWLRFAAGTGDPPERFVKASSKGA